MILRTTLIFFLIVAGAAGCTSIKELTSPCACLENPINEIELDAVKPV